MCGIAGYISVNNSLEKSAFAEALQQLNHRGPDAEGMFVSDDAKVILGHKRLSILDLSSAANQPFFSACGRYCIVYNGEIYNYNEIRDTLGLQTKTSGDTEVVIEAFAKVGVDAFKLLNGMFAFAIYDLQDKKLYLARDRFGIKPLFLYQDNDCIAFASELKFFKKISSLNLKIDYSALPEFLHIGFIAQPRTIYRNIIKFPSASYAIVHRQNNLAVDKFTFWTINEAVRGNTYSDVNEVKSTVKELLVKSVEKQLVSDVPIGTFLSGGIDSSLITAIAARIKQDKIKTFSIGYNFSKYDESEYAEKVAKAIGTEHYAFHVSEDEVEEILSDIIFQVDEPFADSSLYPTELVSKLARNHVTVSLSGDGGDELFLGYGMYNWAERLAHPIVQTFRTPVYWATRYADNVYKRGGLLLNYPGLNHIRSHIFSQEQYYHSDQELRKLLLDDEFSFDSINPLSSILPRRLSPKECQSLWDIKYYLKDDLLVKVDRASMKYSLESRVPYLDNNLFDYAINIDASLRYKGGISKYLLKEVLYEYLPKELFSRPKWGFSIPLSEWMKGRYRWLMDKYLNPTIINRYDIMSNIHVQQLKQRFLAGEEYLYVRLWTIIILHWWLEENA